MNKSMSLPFHASMNRDAPHGMTPQGTPRAPRATTPRLHHSHQDAQTATPRPRPITASFSPPPFPHRVSGASTVVLLASGSPRSGEGHRSFRLSARPAHGHVERVPTTPGIHAHDQLEHAPTIPRNRRPRSRGTRIPTRDFHRHADPPLPRKRVNEQVRLQGNPIRVSSSSRWYNSTGAVPACGFRRPPRRSNMAAIRASPLWVIRSLMTPMASLT